MKAEYIVLELFKWLPRFTDKFSEYFTPDSVAVVGDTVTINKVSHGLVDGSLISVTDSLVETEIDTITDAGTHIVFKTVTPHDLTLQSGVQKTVNLTSALTPAVDGDYQLVAVPNREEFWLASFPDTGVTDLILNEDRFEQMNDVFNISLIDDGSFSFVVSEALSFDPTIKTSSVKVHNQIRISSGEDISRIARSYEDQSFQELWGFVVLDDVSPSKDRNVANSDATFNQGGLNEWDVKLISPFNFYVFVPSKESSGVAALNGGRARDLCEELRPPIYRSICGTSIPTGFSAPPDSAVAPEGDGIWQYRKYVYIHQYQFSQVGVVNNSDIQYKPRTVAFRDVTINYLDVFNSNDNVLMTADISLDEEPL